LQKCRGPDWCFWIVSGQAHQHADPSKAI